MKAKEYNLMSMAVENGISYGYARAFKHTDDPSEEAIRTAIYEAVMNEICENFSFEDQYER